LLDIDSYAGSPSDAKKSQVRGMREVEVQMGVRALENRLSVGTVGEFQTARLSSEVMPQHIPEKSPTSDEAVTVTVETESTSTVQLRWRKQVSELAKDRSTDVKVGGPNVDSVGWLRHASR
jgi:hypothetical protein